MAKRANRTVIGAFVVFAAILVVAALLLYGSGRLFTGKQRYVLYFRESLNGLSVGAPVTLHGVRIGSVSSIRVKVNLNGPEYSAPVIIEVRRNTFPTIMGPNGATARTQLTPQQAMEVMIHKGLRGQLRTLSFITGTLDVSLDFYPGTPATLFKTTVTYPQIPTIPTTLERFSQTVESLPIRQIADNLQHLTQRADELLSSPHAADSLARLDQSLKNLSDVTANLKTQTGEVTAEVQATLTNIRKLTADLDRQAALLSASARTTLAQGQRVLQNANETTVPRLNSLLEHADSRIDPLADRLATAIASAQTAADAATKTLRDASRAAAGLPSVEQELSAALNEAASAARAIRELAD
jgi:paraquat-inducible protein B